MNEEADELCRLSMDTKMNYVGMHPSLFTGELHIYAMCAWSDGGFRYTGTAASAFIIRARTNMGMLVIMMPCRRSYWQSATVSGRFVI